jgi:hypothetical protein
MIQPYLLSKPESTEGPSAQVTPASSGWRDEAKPKNNLRRWVCGEKNMAHRIEFPC